MKLAQYSFLIFIFLKQFYIFNSGSLQPGDLFLLISFFFIVIIKKKASIISKIDYCLFVFLFCVILINFTYYFIYLDMTFIMSILHYIFSFLVVIVFRKLSQEDNFISQLLNVLKINLITQFFILIMGLGEYYSGVRYMGTFNDPNQFAFFVYITLMLLILGSKLQGKKVNLIFYLITLFMIFESSSTGMLLAITTYILMLILFKILNTKVIIFKIKPLKIIIISFIIIIFIIPINNNKEEIFRTINEMPIINRVTEKFEKINVNETSNNKLGLIEERGIDKLFLYPEYLIFGAGQGKYIRFTKASHFGEIHSTLPSILFSYGIIPFSIAIGWFYNNLKNTPVYIYAVFLSLFIESFTLLNQRQPFFWMLFILANLYNKHNYLEIKSHDFSNNKLLRRIKK